MNISVKTNSLKSTAGQIDHTRSKLKSTAATISKVSKTLKFDMESYAIVSTQLGKQATSLSNLSKKADRLQQGLIDIAALYQKTEQNIVKARQSAKTPIGKKTKSTTSTANGKSAKTCVREYTWKDFKKWLYSTFPKDEADKIIAGMTAAAGIAGANLNKIKVEFLYAEASAGAGKGTANAKAGAGIYRITVPGKKGLYSTSMEVNVGCADAGATGKASLKDGLSGEATTEAKGVDVKVKRRLGGKYYNYHEEYNVTVGDAKAYAKGGLSKKGIDAEVGAEAYVVTAKGSRGATVAGVSATVGVGIKGAGGGATAKADVGSDHVNASASIGAGGGVEADVSIDASEADDYYKELSDKYLGTRYTVDNIHYSSGGGGGGSFGSGGGGGGLGGR